MITSSSQSEKSSYSEIQTFKPDNQELSLLNLTNQMIKSGEVKTSLEFANKFMFALDSKEPFPIDIEFLIELEVYDKKGNAKVKLEKNFILDTDYQVEKLSSEFSENKKIKDMRGIKNREIIKLTIDTFKTMCMMSKKGKEIKKYIDELEKVYGLYKSKIKEKNKLILNTNSILKLNNIEIDIRPSDGYVNLTKLCQAGNKRYKHWRENKKTEAFLQVLSSTVGIPTVDLLRLETGGNGERHTYGHPQLAINMAQWISAEFDVQVSKHIFELYTTGKVELGKEKSNEELESIWKKKILQLENNHEEQLILKDIEKQNAIDLSWIIKYDGIPVFYIGFIGIIDGKKIYKFGFSDDFKTRRYNHIRVYGRFDIIFIVDCERNNVLERRFKTHSSIKKVRFSYVFCEENRTELIALDDSFTIDKILKITKKLKKDVDETLNKEMKHKERVMELENERIKIELENKTRQMEIELENKTRQMEIELENKTRQMEIELEILKLKQNQSNSESIEDEIEFEIVESETEDESESEDEFN